MVKKLVLLSNLSILYVFLKFNSLLSLFIFFEIIIVIIIFFIIKIFVCFIAKKIFVNSSIILDYMQNLYSIYIEYKY
ncbi:hypothetical protein [Enterobacteriaceae endosymbiont of Donacia provostii]|uniref:hypothetical protein n=1 Tax=Enterobacteriaceae endosymbiont of Donacia provostii TaxID=2675781 RepID=UPI001FE614C2|nr:hypothetical protein [Enterobacteriaceae endosymbiont of Donacia provostii]